MHIGLPKSERVHISLVVQVRQAMIDETMGGLVAAHGVHDVQKSGVVLEPPVILRDGRCRSGFPVIAVHLSKAQTTLSRLGTYHAGTRPASISAIQRVLRRERRPVSQPDCMQK